MKISEVLTRVGDKWTIQIVLSLRDSPQRFNELRRLVNGISQQMLTRTLKLLERDGVLARTVYPTVPPQVEYQLTDLGRSLSEMLLELGTWARNNLEAIHDNRVRYDTRNDG